MPLTETHARKEVIFREELSGEDIFQEDTSRSASKSHKCKQVWSHEAQTRVC